MSVNPAENAAWLAEAGETRDTDVEVQIPGQFVATYREGTIVRWTFTPAASHPGYSGDAADQLTRVDEDDLRVDEVDSPFWLACQKVLGPVDGVITVVWTE